MGFPSLQESNEKTVKMDCAGVKLDRKILERNKMDHNAAGRKAKVKVKSAHESSGPSGQIWFLYNEATRGITTSPWMGCLSIAGLPPALNSPVPICTPGWRGVLVREQSITSWKIPKNRNKGDKVSLTGERVKGIQSSSPLTEVTKPC